MACGCGGDCCKQPDPRGALLSGLSGLMGDLPPIHRESWFVFGFELDPSSIDNYDYYLFMNLDDVMQRIVTALNASGYASVDTIEKLSGVRNPFIQLEGKSGREYGSASHLKKAVSDVIQGLGYRFDPNSVNFYADTYNPSTGESAVSQDIGANNQSVSSGDSSNCSFTNQKLTDYIACQLGVTPTSAATIGVVGGLVAALLLVKAIK